LSKKYNSLSSPQRGILHSLLGPNILTTIFLNTRSLRSSLSASYKVSHSYKTTFKIKVLYILIFVL
jgi:hypothetical protein